MLKFATALSAAPIMGWALVGSATTASAGYRQKGCCGPIPPSYTYKTKKVYKNITRYRDVWRFRFLSGRLWLRGRRRGFFVNVCREISGAAQLAYRVGAR